MKIAQLKYYIPYVIILILALFIWFKGCGDKPIVKDNTIIKTNIKKLEIKKVAEQIKANKSDSIRIKYIVKWRLKIKDSIVYKPCEELIIICDSIITVDSTQISQLRHVNVLNDSIINQQKIIIYNDSIDKVCLTKYGKKQRRQKNLALLGLGVLGGILIVK
jgi:hypothetical protein